MRFIDLPLGPALTTDTPRPAPIETKPLTAREQFAVYRRTRPRFFPNALLSNEADKHELALLNLANKEFWDKEREKHESTR